MARTSFAAHTRTSRIIGIALALGAVTELSTLGDVPPRRMAPGPGAACEGARRVAAERVAAGSIFSLCHR